MIDGLDHDAIGAVAREAAICAFWSWYGEPSDGVAAPTDPVAREAALAEYTCWLHDTSDRELGARVVRDLERQGYRIERVKP